MNTANPPLPLGYSPVLPGQVANVVTCLEMRQAPDYAPSAGLPDNVRLEPTPATDLDGYRALFRRIGEPWLWHSRLTMPDEKLRNILRHPKVHSFALCRGSSKVGLIELDFRVDGNCELAFFGLAPEAIGSGLGREMMLSAVAMAWAQPIRRFWVHTCSFDHPKALGFYIRSGFKPFAFQVELQADPRLTGHLPRHAAPHVPLLEPAGQ